MTEAGKDWKVYHDGLFMNLLFTDVLLNSLSKCKSMDNFFTDARNGNLPEFSFIEPKYNVNC